MLNVAKANVVNNSLPRVEWCGALNKPNPLIRMRLTCGALAEQSGMIDHFS